MEKPASRSLLNVTVLLATWPPRPPIQVIHFLGPEQSLPIASASKVHVWRMLHNSLINLVTTMSFIPFLIRNVHCPWVGTMRTYDLSETRPLRACNTMPGVLPSLAHAVRCLSIGLRFAQIWVPAETHRLRHLS